MNIHILDQHFAKRNDDQTIEYLARRDKIQRILELKEQKNVLILGHNYMAPLVYNLSGEGQRGDSLQLAKYAAQCQEPIILFDGVRFMAETAKILNPSKKVLIADLKAGCSLADPCRADKVKWYKEKYPDLPVVIYINSYADAKAESDYCCTSSNGLAVVEHVAREYQTKQVIFLPDSLMGANIQEELQEKGSTIELIYPGKYDKEHGSCEVHEQISVEMVKGIRKQFGLPKLAGGEKNPETAVLVHWECLPEVRKEADFCSSTSKMASYVKEHPSLKKVFLGTECEMTANMQAEFPQIEFIRTCSVSCQHMARITIDKILETLENEAPEVTVPEDIRVRALVPIERMLRIGK